MLQEFNISSSAIRGNRQVWISEPSGDSKILCLFLDAELYLDRVNVLDVINDLTSDEEFPQTTFAFLSYGQPNDRHEDFICNDKFAYFLVHELLDWLASNFGKFEKVYLCGLSLSGLAAVHAAATHPNIFDGVLSQSPSAWWNGEWLTQNFPSSRPSKTRFWMSVGKAETQVDVLHSPSLYQEKSQLMTCRNLARRIFESGQQIHFSEFNGGHDPVCWSSELPSALTWLLGQELNS